MDCSMPGFPVLHYLLEFTQTHVHSVSDTIQTISSSAAPFSSCPQSFPCIRVFSNELTLHIRWPKYGSFSFSISPSNEYSGFISFRIDWFDFLVIQGPLKSLLQHHNLKASVLQWSTFVVQLSHLYMTTGKTIALIIWKFVGKMLSLLFFFFFFLMSLLFNMVSSFVTAFLSRSKCLDFMAAVTVCSDFGAQENKICHCFHFFPFYLP